VDIPPRGTLSIKRGYERSGRGEIKSKERRRLHQMKASYDKANKGKEHAANRRGKGSWTESLAHRKRRPIFGLDLRTLHKKKKTRKRSEGKG